MRLDELTAGIAHAAGDAGTAVTSITADSRQAGPGAVFAALPGAKLDGRAFIGAAVAAGAAAVLAPEGTVWPQDVPARPLITAADPRAALARMAARLAGPQPGVAVAVTGTNGKTSTADFLRQIWGAGHAASIGTLGILAPGFETGPGLTTPDPVLLHNTLAALARAGIGHVAMEASSHGLEQRRLDGVALTAAGFTNLTRDHLDYHGTMAAYRAAKLRLFDTLLPQGGPGAYSTEMDGETRDALLAIAARRGLRLLAVGAGGADIDILRARPLPDGLALDIAWFGARETLHLPLPGRFQADNALLAAALAVASGTAPAAALAAIPRLKGVRGRMELAASPNGAAAYVDFAHTPDALERLLTALRPHTTGRLICAFGAGGDRDPGKRPLMGGIVARLADIAIITDDNPRSEDPALIRAAIRAEAPAALEIGDRRAAIAHGLALLRPGDVLVVAGKGHESGQTVRGVTTPFDDAQVIRECLA
ncbi:UDP-N-acetylmuramoyl-L-alanyl-D-glutamate--2,6-diaminopimelate ligase [Rhodovarius lipocyclicus]|uniref:UDP-N-acetylmuramoyl-L-alanyl-D-glutamate--2, 6-diaminopimelate ligase n=1 Tax=Rhodovarius lipocyclicus TaxID=268410 RepID=UPI001F3C6825|nr:UDP-N-acetylmuramoyl-L-alanyl-D-glutamate--2,6-diaminopimelate ligase [Rhodovarius lipocyclicus]